MLDALGGDDRRYGGEGRCVESTGEEEKEPVVPDVGPTRHSSTVSGQVERQQAGPRDNDGASGGLQCSLIGQSQQSRDDEPKVADVASSYLKPTPWPLINAMIIPTAPPHTSRATALEDAARKGARPAAEVAGLPIME